MDERKFNSHMHFFNEIWAAKVLNMKINPERGPDLIDNEKAVEVKFKLLYQNKHTDKCWRVLGHQLDYDKDCEEVYWGLGFYKMNKEVKNIKTFDLGRLEKFVTERELYILEWNWVKQFPLYHQNGKTKISEWDHYISYPKFHKFPSIISSKEVKGGKLFFTEGVNTEDFI